ncbi:MAG TPA: dienelactone hydrolase family protein [Solirubrobacteraceae bacterium]|nr:dienelactone hydrolase family protein [Solirubrobacteraceae bacterium]
MITRSERIQTTDGAFDAHVAIPQSGSGPGMLLIHEIFGVNDYVKDAARRLAELGYVVLAPDLYWRTQPGLALRHEGEDLQRAFAAMGQLDVETAARDAVVALAALRELPEVASAGGRAGVLGFCLGGTLAYRVAVHSDPDTAVCYYGSGIPGALDDAASILSPTLLHWGGADPFIAREQVDAVAAMAAGREGFECHVHEDAGHAFDNSFAPQFHHPAAAAAAWELTSAFLERTLARA